MRFMTLRVEVLNPHLSRISKEGSRLIVKAQPGAWQLTYGWSIQVPAKSKLVGMRQGLFFNSVLLRASRPSCGSRSKTIYSIPLSSQTLRFESEPPSLLTTRISGFTISKVGIKSKIPLPAFMYASLTYLMLFTMKRRSCSE